MKSFILLLTVFFILIAFSYGQRNQQDYVKLLCNQQHEWKWDGTIQTLGRINRCTSGEYIQFLSSPDILIKRTCNDKGTWDTTKVNWILTKAPGSKWFLEFGKDKYRLFITEGKEGRTLTLTTKVVDGNIRNAGTDRVYVSLK